MKTYTEEEFNQAVREKTEQSFKAGMEKGRSSIDNSSLLGEIEDLKAELKGKDETLKGALEKLKPYEEKAKYEKDFSSFVESNGKEEVDLSDYNYSKYAQEDGTIAWDKFLEKHPSLAKEQKEIKKDPTLEAPEVVVSEVEATKAEMAKATSDMKLSNV